MLLSLILWSPLLAGLLLALLPAEGFARIRQVALLMSLIHFGITLYLLRHFDPTLASMQYVERFDWLPEMGVRYSLGVDGISILLIVLNGLLTPFAILCSWKAISERVKEFHVLIFALQSAVHGVFMSQDLFLFYIFWEASLLPMYFLIGVWGGERRLYATLKFVLYTLAGSLLMLLAMIAMAFIAKEQTGHLSFDFSTWRTLKIPLEQQRWLFLAFFLALAVKVPLWPLHTWLPDAHVEAPTAGSVLLAGVLLKLGSYGMLRFCPTLFPEAAILFQKPIVIFCLIGTILGAAMVLVQDDFKKMVAYSSVSHMGLCVLGIFSFNLGGQQGAVLTMLNHGLSTGALFLIVGIFYERTHTRDLHVYGGAVVKMPLLGLLFLPIAMSSMGVPGTNGFVNEFLVLRGAYLYQPWVGVVAAGSIVLGAAYMLRLTQRVMYGPLKSPVMEHLVDLDSRELAQLSILVLLIFLFGIFPNLMLSRSEASVHEGLLLMMRGALPNAIP